MKILKRLFILVLLTSLVACSLEVKKANAPTNPPKVRQNKFSTEMIEGEFAGELNVLFFWPTEKWDSKNKKYVPLSFDEQAESRKTIVRFLEEKTYYQKQLENLTVELDKQYGDMLTALEASYREAKCYALCDLDDYPICDPDDEDNLYQDKWKTPENEEEEAAILACQKNEEKRLNLDSEKEKELAPANEKLQKASKGFLAAVGDDNNIDDFVKFEFVFDNIYCSILHKNENSTYACTKSSRKSVYIKLIYKEGIVVSNYENENPAYLINNIQLDEENGYLSFSGPALSFENGVQQFGQWEYDLEFNFISGLMRVEGDVVLKNKSKENGRVGRFFSEAQR